jgi:hypothetical protein
VQVTPLVHSLCCPAPEAASSEQHHVSNIVHFVGLYDDAPGALRVLCDAVLREWLQRTSGQAATGGIGPAAAELKVIFHQLLELLLDPDRNMCDLTFVPSDACMCHGIWLLRSSLCPDIAMHIYPDEGKVESR